MEGCADEKVNVSLVYLGTPALFGVRCVQSDCFATTHDNDNSPTRYHPDSHPDTKCHSYANANSFTHTNTDAHTDTCFQPYANTNKDANANPITKPDTDRSDCDSGRSGTFYCARAALL